MRLCNAIASYFFHVLSFRLRNQSHCHLEWKQRTKQLNLSSLILLRYFATENIRMKFWKNSAQMHHHIVWWIRMDSGISSKVKCSMCLGNTMKSNSLHFFAAFSHLRCCDCVLHLKIWLKLSIWLCWHDWSYSKQRKHLFRCDLNLCNRLNLLKCEYLSIALLLFPSHSTSTLFSLCFFPMFVSCWQCDSNLWYIFIECSI